MERLEIYAELSEIRPPKERVTLPLWRPSVQRIHLSEVESILVYNREREAYERKPNTKRAKK